MDYSVVNDLLIVGFSILLIAAAVQDLHQYKISNKIILMLAALYPAFFFTSPSDISLLWSLSIAGGFFLVGLGLFSAGVMGGGDVKLISVTGLWVGLNGLMPFVFVMALVGGVMSIFMLMMPLRISVANLCTQFGLNAVQEKIMTDQLPYGVAISAGGLFVAYQMVFSV